MAPTITVDADPTQVDGSTTAPLAALGQPVRLPAPTLLGQALTDQLAAGVAALREQRGKVTKPEDTHDLVRAVQSGRNALQDLVNVLRAVIALCDAVHLEELATAMGVDTNGIPKANMAVPFDGETIKLTREFETEYTTDLDQLLACVQALVEKNWRADGDDPAEDPGGFAAEVARVVLGDIMGKTSPKITGVRALAATLGHKGDDTLAAVATDSHRRVGSTFKRLKVEQVNPLQESSAFVPLGRRR